MSETMLPRLFNPLTTNDQIIKLPVNYCSENQLTSFYMIRTLVNELRVQNQIEPL